MSESWRRLLARVVAIAFFLVLVEVMVLRVSHLVRLDPLLLPDRTLGWRLIPNLNGAHKPYEVYTDRQGFRISPSGRGQSRRSFDVVFVGDSFCFGSGVDYSESLVGRFAGAHPKLSVANYGVPGYGTDQEYLILRRYISLLQPGGIVVMVTYLNDFDDIRDRWYDARLKPWFTLSGSKLVLHKPHSLLNSLCWYCRTAYVIAHLIVGAGGVTPRIRGSYAYADGLYGALLVRMARLVTEHRGRLVIVYTSGQEAGSTDALQREQSARCWAARTGSGFIDLDDMPDAQNPGLYMKNDVHWNATGSLLNYDYFVARLRTEADFAGHAAKQGCPSVQSLGQARQASFGN
jgi:hypothetical protein